MNKRGFLDFIMGALTVSLLTARAHAGTSTFVVPKNVKALRVVSYVGTKKVIDTELDVEPGQVFKIIEREA